MARPMPTSFRQVDLHRHTDLPELRDPNVAPTLGAEESRGPVAGVRRDLGSRDRAGHQGPRCDGPRRQVGTKATSTSFWDHFARVSQPPYANPITRRVTPLPSAYAYLMLIGACNPMGGCYGWLLWVVAMGGCCLVPMRI